MELDEILRLIWQALLNVPKDAPEREKAIRAYGALTSKLNYETPARILVFLPGDFIRIETKK